MLSIHSPRCCLHTKKPNLYLSFSFSFNTGPTSMEHRNLSRDVGDMNRDHRQLVGVVSVPALFSLSTTWFDVYYF